MKKITLPLITGILITSVFSFAMITNSNKAEVEQLNGLYLFTDCKPLQEYTIIGEVKIAAVNKQDMRHANIRQVLVDKAKKAYPTAEALIFKYEEYKMPRAEVIDLKD